MISEPDKVVTGMSKQELLELLAAAFKLAMDERDKEEAERQSAEALRQAKQRHQLNG
jgi:hypothetical protein